MREDICHSITSAHANNTDPVIGPSVKTRCPMSNIAKNKHLSAHRVATYDWPMKSHRRRIPKSTYTHMLPSF